MKMKNLQQQIMLKVLVIGKRSILKTIIKKTITIINFLYLKLFKNLKSINSTFYLTKIINNKNSLLFNNSKIEKTLFNIDNNYVKIDNSYLSEVSVNIKGENNQLIIKNGVKLRKATINIRGNNCKVIIGENTTFGGVRIINVGIDNDIIIGRNCLFSDNIEIWASDTHSIFDENGFMINNEKPIIIEDNVWVGAYVKILKGVKIGKGSIIGINSLLTKDIEEKTLCAGNPIKILKRNVSWNLDYKGIK